MFQKSLSILIAAVLIALAAVAVFAFFNPAGATQAIAKAEDLIAREQFAAAVNELGRVEGSRSVEQDPALKERVWRLRYGANSQLGNVRGALLDVENLLQLGGADDEELQLDHIRLRARAGEGERARQLATAFLERHPGSSRGLELAGEACQTVYLQPLRELRATIEKDIGKARLDEALGAMLAYIYRPDGDAEVAQGIEHLNKIYSAEPRLASAWQPVWRRLRDLRASVQEGLGFFRSSLEAGGKPVAAFRGFALALQQSQRTDDLLVQCEIYRRSFDHQFVPEAGVLATWALVQAGLAAAAVATAERWQPSGRVQQLVASTRVTTAVTDLLMARAFAAWRAGDSASLHRIEPDITALVAAGTPPTMAIHLTFGSLQFLSKDFNGAEANQTQILNSFLRVEAPLGQPDFVTEFGPVRLDLMRQRRAPAGAVMTVLAAWQRARPFDITPRRLAAEYQLELGNTAAALAAVDDSNNLAPNDEQLFALRLAAARLHYQEFNQDGPALLQQCLKRNVAVPEVPNPIGLVLCAEAALEQKRHAIARECARSAVDAFPQVRHPRLLEVRANLAADRPEEAARLATKLLELLPPDEQTSLLALQACRAADLPAASLLFTAIRACRPGPELQTALLRSALESAPSRAALFAANVQPDGETAPELRILAAQALARSGQSLASARLLDGLAETAATLPLAQQAELAAAFVAWLEGAAAERTDVELHEWCRPRIQQLSDQAAAAAPHLLASAAKLAATHARTAYALCTAGLAMAEPSMRTGQTWALAGRLALALGYQQLAEDHWTAALAFPESRSIAEDLARLCVASGRIDRALQIYALVKQPTDAALAQRFGRVEAAAQLAASDLERDAADLLAHCSMAAVGEDSLTDWRGANEPVTQERLELLSLLRCKHLGPQARARAEALVTAEPGSTTNQLLLARALVAVGEVRRAAELHAAVAVDGGSPVVWREVALAGATPGYAMDPRVARDLMGACTNKEIADSSITLVYGLQQMAQRFVDGGHPELGEEVRTSMWLQAPRASTLSTADIGLLANRAAPRDVCVVLEQVLEDRTRTDRPIVLLHFIAAADRLVRERAPSAADAYAAALRLCDSEGPYGCLVHFLLEHGPHFPDLRPDAARRRQLLLGQLELAAADRDPGPWLQNTVDALLEQGVQATVEDLEGVLRQHPTALALWHARAATMTHMQMAAAGIGDLRAVLAHGADAFLQLAFVTLAAQERLLTADDKKLLENLPQGLLQSPAGTFARGLVALRLGKPDEAVPMLEAAGPRTDGMHLYALALALLQSRAADGPARAADLFSTLARSYASNSLARNAGSFANQLSPR